MADIIMSGLGGQGVLTAGKILINIAAAEGKNVSEVYGSVGFNDYSSFLKAFVKLVGVSPKKYSKFN